MTLDNIVHNARSFIALQKAHWKETLSYRAQSVIYLLFFLIIGVSGFVAITIIYGVSKGILGWSYYQMLALSATATLLYSLVVYLFDPQWLIDTMIRGAVDMDFSKPVNRQLMMMSMTGSKEVSSAFVGAFLILGYALLHLHFTALQFVGYALLFVAGAAAMILVWMLIIVGTYHLFKMGWFLYTLQSIFQLGGQYPVTLFGAAGGLAFTFLFPTALATTYPVEALIGGISSYVYFSILALAIAIAALAYLGTKELMKHYASGGG